MKNKKGFTVIELGISFCIVSTIAIMLFQLVISIKDLYLAGNIKTTLLNKQGIITKRIHDDLEAYDLVSVNSCGISCLEFTYNKKNEAIEAKKSKLLIDPFNTTITYDDYSILLSEGSSIGNIVVDYDKVVGEEVINTNNRVLQIKIPIYNSLVEGDYGLNVVIEYDDAKVVVDNEISISEVYLTLNDINIEIKDLYDATVLQGTYAKIFYHNIDNGNNLFTSRSDFMENSSVNKFSALFALDLFEGKYNASNKNSFEFLLYYPTSTVGGANNYNHWIQSNNFTKENVSGYEPIDILWNAAGEWNGLDYINNDCGFSDGLANASSSCYFTIGAKKAISNNLVFLGSTSTDIYQSQDVALWVRIDDYINKYSLSKIIH